MLETPTTPFDKRKPFFLNPLRNPLPTPFSPGKKGLYQCNSTTPLALRGPRLNSLINDHSLRPSHLRKHFCTSIRFDASFLLSKSRMNGLRPIPTSALRSNFQLRVLYSALNLSLCDDHNRRFGQRIQSGPGMMAHGKESLYLGVSLKIIIVKGDSRQLIETMRIWMLVTILGKSLSAR